MSAINVSQLREEPRKSCGNCDFSGDGHCWESGFAALLPDVVCDKWQEMLCVSLAKAAELALELAEDAFGNGESDQLANNLRALLEAKT